MADAGKQEAGPSLPKRPRFAAPAGASARDGTPSQLNCSTPRQASFMNDEVIAGLIHHRLVRAAGMARKLPANVDVEKFALVGHTSGGLLEAMMVPSAELRLHKYDSYRLRCPLVGARHRDCCDGACNESVKVRDQASPASKKASLSLTDELCCLQGFWRRTSFSIPPETPPAACCIS